MNKHLLPDELAGFPVATTPEELGIPTSALLQFQKDLDAMPSLHGVIALRHGKVFLCTSWAPFDLESKGILHSLSKSFTSAAIGIAQSEGYLNINDTLLKYFPEYEDAVTDEKMRVLTLRDLLTMTSGHADCAMAQLRTAPTEWVRCFLATQLQYAPGTHFAYNSAGTHMLAAVVHKTTGQNVREYLMPRLFEPLDILPGLWENSSEDINCGGWGLLLSTADIAKFAQCLLQNGSWNGKQLIPADYLAEATRKQSDNSRNERADWKLGYGYQFWRSQHGYRGDGAFGQLAIVIPELDLAIALNSTVHNFQDLLDLIWKFVEQLQDAPLPPCSPELLARSDALMTDRFDAWLAAGAQGKPSTRSVHNVLFHSNELTASFDASSTRCALTFRYPNHHQEQLAASFLHPDGLLNSLTLNSDRSHFYRATARWQDDHTVVIRALSTDMRWQDTYTIDLSPEGTISFHAQWSLGIQNSHKQFLTSVVRG
ncbi:MAG: serine hydrolase [Victivallales bacterium]|nr:serine hydrolase [Victivallales bacterium]